MTSIERDVPYLCYNSIYRFFRLVNPLNEDFFHKYFYEENILSFSIMYLSDSSNIRTR